MGRRGHSFCAVALDLVHCGCYFALLVSCRCLMRLVDDFLLITPDQHEAQAFLKYYFQFSFKYSVLLEMHKIFWSRGLEWDLQFSVEPQINASTYIVILNSLLETVDDLVSCTKSQYKRNREFLHVFIYFSNCKSCKATYFSAFIMPLALCV